MSALRGVLRFTIGTTKRVLSCKLLKGSGVVVVARAARPNKRGFEDLKWVLPRLVTVVGWVQLEGLNSFDMADLSSAKVPTEGLYGA